MQKLEVVTNNRNQSTVNISHSHMFLFDNEFTEDQFFNNTGVDFFLTTGILVIRDPNNGNRVLPAIAGPTLSGVVGIVTVVNPKTIIPNESVDINYCHEGTVDKGLIVLPDSVTLDTLVGPKTLSDTLTGLGLHLVEVSSNNRHE